MDMAMGMVLVQRRNPRVLRGREMELGELRNGGKKKSRVVQGFMRKERFICVVLDWRDGSLLIFH